jgi:RimJ/RimL family protein N-acetyltransferase
VLLVPYERSHVLKYHGWMQDPAIQDATASEPLSLEEEYDNQESWRTSPDKLTFIVCQPLPSTSLNSSHVVAGEVDSPAHMIGDINFFIYPSEEEDKEGLYEGEVDIMIAEPAHRSKGIGKEAVSAFLWWIIRHSEGITEEFNRETEEGGGGMDLVMARIKKENEGSIRLFKSLGFEQVGDVNYFGEIKLVLSKELFASFAGGGAARGFREVEYRREG